MAYTFKHGDRPLDDYTIQRAVGCGGFGEVYYAVSDGGREVALKYLRQNPQIELRGVSHCINLKSPHLVSIFDVKKNADGEYFIVMEYCSGPSLRDLLIAEPNGYEPQKAAFFVREIGKGLAYLHDRGIVHRDLKPGNIFYDDGYVKIGDYGLSKFISVSRHSVQTASVGTVHYMAPEIGSGNYSRGVDIYALGVMLYEMLLGRLPFDGSTMAEVLMKHLTAQPELDNLPQPFGDVIRKALEKDPKDRYQTVDEMIEDLLQVEEVKRSLAGFSPQSLDGAVHRGAADRAASPMPSPNPIPNYARDFGQEHQPPPLRQDVVLPKNVAERMDRISRKFGAKMHKLGVTRYRGVAGPAPTPASPGYGAAAHAGEGPDGLDETVSIHPTGRGRRMMLSGILSLAMVIALGVVVGANVGVVVGVSASMSVVALAVGVGLTRKAWRWFDVLSGPGWAQRVVAVGCCAPLLLLAACPALAEKKYEHDGLAVFLGLLAVSLFCNWKGVIEHGRKGELSFGNAIWMAFCGALAVGIIGGIAVDDGLGGGIPYVGAGIAGTASLIVQASSWWMVGGGISAARKRKHARAFIPAVAPPPAPQPLVQGNDAWLPPFAIPVGQPGGVAPGEPPPQQTNEELTGHCGTSRRAPADYGGPRVRWGITRAFWGIVAFLLMCGAIVTFLLVLILDSSSLCPSDRTGTLIGCVACGAMMIFALCKMTPMRRDGFWRDSLRPFLISLSLFGIGATITGISRGCNLPDDDFAGLIVGLVFSSLFFLGFLFFTGRKRKPPKPFLVGTAAGQANCCDAAGIVGGEAAAAPAENRVET